MVWPNDCLCMHTFKLKLTCIVFLLQEKESAQMFSQLKIQRGLTLREKPEAML